MSLQVYVQEQFPVYVIHLRQRLYANSIGSSHVWLRLFFFFLNPAISHQLTRTACGKSADIQFSL